MIYQSTSWRLRKAGSVVPVQTPWLEDQGVADVSPGPRAGEELHPSSCSQAERANSSSLSLFVLFRPPKDWMNSPTLGRAAFFTQSTNLNVNPLWKQTHPEILFS